MARQRLLADTRRNFPGATIKVVHKDVLEFSWLAPSPPVIASPKDVTADIADELRRPYAELDEVPELALAFMEAAINRH